MTELSEIQLAMCKVIKECGFEGLNKVKVNEFYISEGRVPLRTDRQGRILDSILGTWTVTLDGHTLTQEEYEAWVKKET